ncbi:MAG: acyl-CoA thioesterase [Thermoanaerobaculia bacterium]|nr:acyl-CoA thioesterase [Thermoanaerobaculia bacterium]MCZ7651719.1 acyl-CoA thioesterase [Thermoanaerobaculia bacterium]
MLCRLPLTVRFGECDPAGIVYMPRILHYFHVAMEELFAAAVSRPYARLVAAEGLGFPSVHVEADFRRPLAHGDRLEIEARIERVGESSCAFAFAIRGEGEDDPRATGRVVTVCIDLASGERRPLPEWLREPLLAAAEPPL